MTTINMLTTVDNPYDPFENYDAWYSWDQNAGYFTPAFLARVVVSSPNLSPADEQKAIEDAIDEIVEENVLGLYRKVSKQIET